MGKSATLSQEVDKATTTTALASAPNPSDVNQFVNLTATITGQYGGIPTGQVTFTSDGKAISECPVPVKLTSQQASCNGSTGTQTLGLGTHTIQATMIPTMMSTSTVAT